MKQLDNISIKELSDALKREGFRDNDRVRITVESIDEKADNLASLAQAGGAFDFWHDEPDHYSDKNVKEWYG